MRPIYLFLPVGLPIPRAVHCDAQHERPGAEEDIEALTNLKYLVDFTSSLASLLAAKNDESPSSDRAQLAVSFEQGLGEHEEVTRHMKDDPAVTVDWLVSLESGSMDGKLSNNMGNTPTPVPLVDSVACSGMDAATATNVDANANNARDILQQYAVLADGFRSGESDSGERGLAPAQDDSVVGTTGTRAGSPLLKECLPSDSVPPPASSVNILDGLEALQHLTWLVQPGSVDSTRCRPSTSERPLSQAGKQSRSKSTGSPTTRQKNAQPPTQDILTRLEAMRRFSRLAQKLSKLSEEFRSLSPLERIHHMISDPEVAPTVQWMFDNAGKVLTPEVLSALKNFIRSSPLVPDEYRSFALLAADSLSTVLNPSLISHYRNFKTFFERLGADLGPVLGSVYRGLHWLMTTFQPSYIQALTDRVTLWRKALTSPEVAEFLIVVNDPVTLNGISASMGSAKKVLTAERVRRLRTIFDERGLFDLSRDEYKAFGDLLGTNIKTQFATAEGISEAESFLDAVHSLFKSQTINAVAGIMQKRSVPLTAGLAEDLHFFFDQVSLAAVTVPGMLEVLRDFLDLIRPLLPPGTRDERLPARVWDMAGFIMEKVSLFQGSALEDLQSVLDAGIRLTHPERLEELRLVIADLQRSEPTSSYLISVNNGIARNASVGASPFEFTFGVFDIQLGPILGPIVADDEKISRLIQILNARLAPGEVEKTRETLQSLNSMPDDVRYDVLMNEMFNTWRDAFRPTPEDCAQLGNGYALYPAFGKRHSLFAALFCLALCANEAGRSAVEGGFISSFSPGSRSAQDSPSSGSELSAKAEIFVPGAGTGAGVGAGAQHRTLDESLCSTSTGSNHFSFVDIQDTIDLSPQARLAAIFPNEPFVSPHTPCHNSWTSIYIDPVHPRMGGGLLCTLPAITFYADPNSSSNSEVVLAQHAPILLALVKDILKNHNPRSRTMICVCTRQSYNLYEGRAVPTVLVTLDFEQDRCKAEAALPEILDLFHGTLGMVDVTVEIIDREFAEWMEGHLRRSIELNRCLEAFQESRARFVGELPDQGH
ncbi:predicted protein [Aspergillus nidulans FGSC A4]|uniref:Uncharacterized protein n=1 Tax=Emericella nidulans (strain FGSC A4 / ATCC 38163 / CBS 112.46 / NRRL 194 / M139) TaxID=227321 RepID=Q5B9V4_EMENI|nr:hypothetical protein [Aspergillus nidulans FGSC A4]EAA63078.1 predicted protein [Aspergillus nidulans FGSC A4]CBF84229.1 TPA: conserved hypothetical protein [Aspergillus nidulans FGSC A4]|eukprot:XP_660280.1 predicted protein [Aspergillus nidulans FGSC A4]